MTPEERMNPMRCVNNFQRNYLKYTETSVSIMHVGEGSRSTTPAWSRNCQIRALV
jgi:hypothetical protein